jgi:hypothetical protein
MHEISEEATMRLTLLMLLAGAGTRAAAPPGDEALIKTPPDARLAGTSTIQEIRAFPEMGSKGKAQAAKLVGIDGVDRMYETDRSFADTVSFFDQEFKQPGFQVQARAVTASATSWTVKRPDGTVANAAVRNTRPTTFEIAEVTAEAVKIKPER